MKRSDRWFLILFAVILVVGGSVVVVGLDRARRGATAEGAWMEASASAMRDLMELHYAMGRYRIEGLSDADGDGIGEHGDLGAVHAADVLDPADWRLVEGNALQRSGYRYRAVLPAEGDDAEQGFAVVGLPGQSDWPVLAIDETGELRVAPAGFRPDPAAPVDPHDWPRWR